MIGISSSLKKVSFAILVVALFVAARAKVDAAWWEYCSGNAIPTCAVWLSNCEPGIWGDGDFCNEACMDNYSSGGYVASVHSESEILCQCSSC